MFDVITMGSNTIDAFANTDAEVIDIRTKAGEQELIAYPMGSKIMIKEMHYDVGGNGVNAAVSLARLGFNVAYLGKIGNDANGEDILQHLNKEGIEFIGTRGDKSGFSVILDTELHEDRTILTFKGCNNNLRNEEIDYEKMHAKWLYLSSMLEESLDSMNHVVGHAKAHGINVAYNPSSTVTKKGLNAIRHIIENTDLLILNQEEAEDLVGHNSVEENLKTLRDMGPRRVVITLGDQGVKALDHDGIYEAHPAPELSILETTGAGDAFASTFTAAMIKEKSFEDCIRMGMLNAESVLGHYGAHNKLLSMEEVEARLEKDERFLEKTSSH